MAAVFNVLGIITTLVSGVLILMVFRSSAYVDQVIPALSIMHSQSLLMSLAIGLAVIAAVFFSAAGVISAISRRGSE